MAEPMRPVLRYGVPGWDEQLRDLLERQTEVDLVEFDFELCGKLCESLARTYAMEISLDRDPAARAIHFRKITSVNQPRNR